MEKTIESSATALALSSQPFPLPSINENEETLDKQVPAETTDPPNTDENNQQAPHDHEGRPVDPNMDPKRLRRVMASRQYSQKYRLKQMQYIMQLETEVKALQAEVTITGPRITYSNRQNSLLRMENSSIKHKLASCSAELMIKEAHYDELKKERDQMKKQSYMVHQYQYPDFFKTMLTPANYSFMNLINWNQTRYDPYMESAGAASGTPQPMMDESSNQFDSTAEEETNMNHISQLEN